MKNIYLEAPNYLEHYALKGLDKAVFLAGSITGAVNWQAEAAKTLAPYFTVFNPRRAVFDVNDDSFDRVQIPWEYHHLDFAGITLFYFSHETLAPITLLEYGKQLVKTKYAPWRKTYVAIHPQYQRKNDVLIQTELENKDILKNVYFSLPVMLDTVINENR